MALNTIAFVDVYETAIGIDERWIFLSSILVLKLIIPPAASRNPNSGVYAGAAMGLILMLCSLFDADESCAGMSAGSSCGRKDEKRIIKSGNFFCIIFFPIIFSRMVLFGSWNLF
jgi:hypothetical protein